MSTGPSIDSCNASSTSGSTCTVLDSGARRLRAGKSQRVMLSEDQLQRHSSGAHNLYTSLIESKTPAGFIPLSSTPHTPKLGPAPGFDPLREEYFPPIAILPSYPLSPRREHSSAPRSPRSPSQAENLQGQDYFPPIAILHPALTPVTVPEAPSPFLPQRTGSNTHKPGPIRWSGTGEESYRRHNTLTATFAIPSDFDVRALPSNQASSGTWPYTASLTELLGSWEGDPPMTTPPPPSSTALDSASSFDVTSNPTSAGGSSRKKTKPKQKLPLGQLDAQLFANQVDKVHLRLRENSGRGSASSSPSGSPPGDRLADRRGKGLLATPAARKMKMKIRSTHVDPLNN